MNTGHLFEWDRRESVLLIVPTCNIGSLAEENVKPELDNIFAQLESPHIKGVVIDFERVEYFGSSMLATLHRLWQQISKTGGKMAICNVSNMGREVFRVTRFDTLWSVCDSRDDAFLSVT